MVDERAEYQGGLVYSRPRLSFVTTPSHWNASVLSKVGAHRRTFLGPLRIRRRGRPSSFVFIGETGDLYASAQAHLLLFGLPLVPNRTIGQVLPSVAKGMAGVG